MHVARIRSGYTDKQGSRRGYESRYKRCACKPDGCPAGSRLGGARHTASDGRAGPGAGPDRRPGNLDGPDEAPELVAAVPVPCMGGGLIVGGLRPGIRESSTLRLAPPLTVTAAEIDEALAVLEDAISAVVAVAS
jgi:hypothetical protein